MTSFYRGDAVWVVPQTEQVTHTGPAPETSLFDDPARLQRAWNATVRSFRADAARPADDPSNIRLAAEVNAFEERYDAHRKAVRAEQELTAQLAAVEAYEEPSAFMQIAGRIGAALHINRFI